MRHIQSNVHILHALKKARPKLHRAIIANSDKELLNSINECALNVLRGNVKLSDCKKRKLHKFKRQLRTIVDKLVPLARKKKHYSVWRVYSASSNCSTAYASDLFTISLRVPNMLRKMYLVSPDYVSRKPPPAQWTPSPQPKAAMPMSRTKKSKQRRQRVTKQKKQHPYDKRVKLKRKIEDADVTRKTLTEKIAVFLQSVLPYGITSAQQSMPTPITPDVRARLMSEAADTASPLYRFCPVHTKVYLHRQ